jgi:hypothetical protein
MARLFNAENTGCLDTPILFGRYLVLGGLITEPEMAAAAAAQVELNGSFAVAALEQGALGLEDFLRCREYQRQKGMLFQEAALELGVLTQDAIEQAQQRMQAERMRIGDILVARGALPAEHLRDALRAYETLRSMSYP